MAMGDVMKAFFGVAIVLASLSISAPVLAKIAGSTADGTWDCRDMNNAPLGTVVVADTSYAFVKLNGRVGTYGKLHQYGEADFHLPHFLVMSGHLKDEIGAVGLELTGPRGNEHNLLGELYLSIIITATNTPYCRRRADPAS